MNEIMSQCVACRYDRFKLDQTSNASRELKRLAVREEEVIFRLFVVVSGRVEGLGVCVRVGSCTSAHSTEEAKEMRPKKTKH